MAPYEGTKSSAIVWLLEIPLPRISQQSFWPCARDEIIPQAKHLACNYNTASICQGAQGRARRKSGLNWIRKGCRPLKEKQDKCRNKLTTYSWVFKRNLGGKFFLGEESFGKQRRMIVMLFLVNLLHFVWFYDLFKISRTTVCQGALVIPAFLLALPWPPWTIHQTGLNGTLYSPALH